VDAPEMVHRTTAKGWQSIYLPSPRIATFIGAGCTYYVIATWDGAWLHVQWQPSTVFMQSLATTELLSFHPLLLETGVCVGIAPPSHRHMFPSAAAAIPFGHVWQPYVLF